MIFSDFTWKNKFALLVWFCNLLTIMLFNANYIELKDCEMLINMPKPMAQET